MTDSASTIADTTPADGASRDAQGLQPSVGRAGGFDFRTMSEQIAALLRKQIFFVGGAAKSGTTWLQVLLDLHPQVSCGGEHHFVEALHPSLKKTLEEHNGVLLDQRRNTAFQLGKTPPLFGHDDYMYVAASATLALLLRQAHGKPAALAVGEKTTTNVQAFTWLLMLFPGAKCIHIVRDPRDGTVSGWHHINRNFPDQARSHFSTLYDYVQHYADVWALEIGRAIDFGAKNPDRYVEVRYEDLVERTAPTLVEIFRFLGVDHGEDVVGQCIREASFEKLSGGRARGQESPGSFFRKGVVGDWKNRLDAASCEYIVAKCGPLMQRFGYL